MQRQSPKAAQGGTDFAMLPSAHRKPEEMFDKRKSELEELRKSHSEDHNQVVAHQKEVEAMKQWSEEAKGQMQGRRPASIVPRAAVAAARHDRSPRRAVAAGGADAGAHVHARGHPRAHDGAADGEGRRGGRTPPEGHGGGGLVPTPPPQKFKGTYLV